MSWFTCERKIQDVKSIHINNLHEKALGKAYLLCFIITLKSILKKLSITFLKEIQTWEMDFVVTLV